MGSVGEEPEHFNNATSLMSVNIDTDGGLSKNVVSRLMKVASAMTDLHPAFSRMAKTRARLVIVIPPI